VVARITAVVTANPILFIMHSPFLGAAWAPNRLLLEKQTAIELVPLAAIGE